MQYVNQGLVLDVTDYLDDELKTYSDFRDPEVFTSATVDDKVYALPKPLPGYAGGNYWIRQDWLDNLNLEMPENTDDFADVLEAFTKQDPDGNSKNDTYGLTGDALASSLNNTAWLGLWVSFGTGGPTSFYEKDGQLINGVGDAATREALEYVAGLVEPGVVDPDYATNVNLKAHERGMQGMAGVMYIGWPEMTLPAFIDQYKKAQPDAEWVQMPPIAGPGGAGGALMDPYATTMYAIPASLADDEEKLRGIFELLNYTSTEEGNRLISYGVEGTHFKLSGDQVTMTEKGLAEETQPFWLYQLTGRNEAEYLATKFPYARDEIAVAWNQPTFPLFDSLVTAPEGYSSADANTFAAEQIAQFVSGKKSFDEWDAFVDQLKNQFGFQDYINTGIEQLEALDVSSD